MGVSPDSVVLWRWGFVNINATLLWTWAVMAVLIALSWWVGRRCSASLALSGSQNFLESVVTLLRSQIEEISQQEPEPYLPFVGTLFLFIALANLLAIVPGYIPPTASLSTTVALAICVFVAVPVFGIARRGWLAYFKQYIQPSIFMLPFNIIGELSRTLALAVRLFGNVMSGRMIGMSLLAVVPLFFPILMDLFGLLTGMIQAYIFAVLAMVYIASATQSHNQENTKPPQTQEESHE